jgi:ABC-2 type transport system permease protein
MKKLVVIVGKELIVGFTNPSALLLAIVMPLAMAALVELAFGGLVLGRGIPDTNIPVGIVNLDRGGHWGNFGEMFVQGVLGIKASASHSVFDVREIEDETQARRMVEREQLVAALVIPPNFSEALATESAAIGMYINDRYIFRGAAFKSLAETLANVISTGEVTVRATVKGLVQNPRTRVQLEAGVFSEALADLALTAARLESNPIQVQRLDPVGQSIQLELKRYFAAAIAILFTGFWGLIGSASLLREKAGWTLQRMYITPTHPGIILAGKTLGTYLGSLIQMLALVGGMAAMEWIGGEFPGPKIDLPGLATLILAVLVSGTGLGVMIAGFATTYTQAANYGRAILLLMGLVGGFFFPVELFPEPLQALSRITYHYWAMDGYVKLALGGRAISILPHVFILVGMGCSFFIVGGWFLRRRIGFS